MKNVHVHYVAMLREQAGKANEIRVTNAAHPAELYEEIARQHQWKYPRQTLRVAINDRITDWQHPLNDQDHVLFVPPSSGG